MPRLRPLPLLATLVALAAPLLVPAAAVAASASIGPVDCDAGGAVVTLTNTGGGPARFTILRDEVAIASAVVPAGPSVTRVVPIAEGAAARVTVRYGSSYVSSYLRRSCSGASGNGAPVTAVAGVSDAPFQASPVIAATGVRTADAAASEPSRAARTGDVTLEDAARTWPLVLVALASMFAVAFLVSGRLRNRIRSIGSRREPAARRRA